MRRYRKIHQQMMFRIIIAVSITIMIISAISYYVISAIIKEHVQHTMQSNAETVVREIEEVISRQKSMLTTYGNFLKQAYIKADTKLIIEQVTREFAMQNDPFVFGYWYMSQSNYDNKGELFTWFGLNGEKSVTDIRKRYQDILLLTENPNSLAPYNDDALQKGELHISAPYLDKLANKPILSISIPIYDEHELLMGVAGIDMPFEEIQEYVSILQHDNVADSMFIITDYDQLVHKETSPLIDKLNVDLSADELFRMLPREMSGQETTSLMYDKRHHLYFYSLPIQGTKWTSFLILPASEMYKLLWKPFVAIAITIVLFILVTVLAKIRCN